MLKLLEVGFEVYVNVEDVSCVEQYVWHDELMQTHYDSGKSFVRLRSGHQVVCDLPVSQVIERLRGLVEVEVKRL